MAFLAKDKDKSEWVYESTPTRKSDCWCCESDLDSMIELPKGSIRKLIGRELTWEDEPVELKGEFFGEEYNYKTSFLRDLQECLNKHHAHINAYYIEGDKLVVDLNHLGGTLTIGPSDDIRIDDRWISNELKGE